MSSSALVMSAIGFLSERFTDTAAPAHIGEKAIKYRASIVSHGKSFREANTHVKAVHAKECSKLNARKDAHAYDLAIHAQIAAVAMACGGDENECDESCDSDCDGIHPFIENLRRLRRERIAKEEAEIKSEEEWLKDVFRMRMTDNADEYIAHSNMSYITLGNTKSCFYHTHVMEIFATWRSKHDGRLPTLKCEEDNDDEFTVMSVADQLEHTLCEWFTIMKEGEANGAVKLIGEWCL